MSDRYLTCGTCGSRDMVWLGLGGLNPYTYCRNCHNTNCQRYQHEDFEDADVDGVELEADSE